MQRKHPTSPSTKMSLSTEIAHLRGLDLKGLRSRCRASYRGRPLLINAAPVIAVIAYRIQADRFGDLDHEPRQVLDRTVAKGSWAGNVRPSGLALPEANELSPGTVLRPGVGSTVAAGDGEDDGFAWNGHDYDSLSQCRLRHHRTSGTVRLLRAFGMIKKIERRWRPAMRLLQFNRSAARYIRGSPPSRGSIRGIKLIGCPVRCASAYIRSPAHAGGP